MFGLFAFSDPSASLTSGVLHAVPGYKLAVDGQQMHPKHGPTAFKIIISSFLFLHLLITEDIMRSVEALELFNSTCDRAGLRNGSQCSNVTNYFCC